MVLRNDRELRRILMLAVALVVCGGWLFTIIAPAFSDYEPSLAVDGPMLGLVAWLFQQQRKSRGRRDDD